MSWRSRFGGREWRLTPDGIVSRGPDGLEEHHRTRGAPRTMRVYLAGWSDELRTVAREEGVPLALLLMTIATENGPASIDEELIRIPVRREPGYVSDEATPRKLSVGPCHPLLSTAREVMADPDIDRGWLQVVENNLRVAARYIRRSATQHGYDPILVAATYNAGSIRQAPATPGPEGHIGNRWHLYSWGNHLDRAATWYGDACAVVYEARELWSMDSAGLGRVGVHLNGAVA